MLSIGIDDTDSRNGMCTTYLAFKITQFLINKNIRILDYPRLIRLNPNVPWKTRGNGAICIRIEDADITKDIIRLVDRYSYVGKHSNPGLIIYKGDIDDELAEFARRALHELIPRRDAHKLALKYDADVYFKGNGQGIVGALASIGSLLDDYTFELIAYRHLTDCYKERQVSKEKVKKMDRETFPLTFNNYDYKHDRVLITPHGPDPVFLGIRGEDPRILLKAFNMLGLKELEGYMIFKSNQGTNAHLNFKLDELKPYSSGYIEGIIDEKPYSIKGGHTFFKIDGKLCAVYEPTGLSNIAQQLRRGDKVRVGGGVRKASKNHPRVLNVEYLHILELVEEKMLINPRCICGKRLKSAGRNKGYKCENCSFKGFKDKEEIIIERRIDEGLYVPVAKAHRHLTKPLHRYGLKKDKHDMIENFCYSLIE